MNYISSGCFYYSEPSGKLWIYLVNQEHPLGCSWVAVILASRILISCNCPEDWRILQATIWYTDLRRPSRGLATWTEVLLTGNTRWLCLNCRYPGLRDLISYKCSEDLRTLQVTIGYTDLDRPEDSRHEQRSCLPGTRRVVPGLPLSWLEGFYSVIIVLKIYEYF